MAVPLYGSILIFHCLFVNGCLHVVTAVFSRFPHRTFGVQVIPGASNPEFVNDCSFAIKLAGRSFKKVSIIGFCSIFQSELVAGHLCLWIWVESCRNLSGSSWSSRVLTFLLNYIANLIFLSRKGQVGFLHVISTVGEWVSSEVDTDFVRRITHPSYSYVDRHQGHEILTFFLYVIGFLGWV